MEICTFLNLFCDQLPAAGIEPHLYQLRREIFLRMTLQLYKYKDTGYIYLYSLESNQQLQIRLRRETAYF